MLLVVDLEASAAVLNCHLETIHGRHYDSGMMLVTDHKPLLSLFCEKRAVPAQAFARIQCWALTLSMYQYTIGYWYMQEIFRPQQCRRLEPLAPSKDHSDNTNAC